MSINELDLGRFTEKLPFFVNGTLNTDEQRWMHLFLAVNPALYEQLRWQHALMHEVVRMEEQVQANAPADLGWSTIASQLGKTSRPSLAHSLVKRFVEFMSRPMVMGSFATSMAVFAVGVLLTMGYVQQQEEPTQYAQFRSCGVQAEDRDHAYFQIGFKPGVTEQQIRLALIQTDVTIVSGPTQMGEYMVKVPRRALDVEPDMLQSLDVIESVSSVRYPH